MKEIAKPEEGEFAPYVSMYIDLLPDDGRVLEHMEGNYEELQYLIASIPADQLVRSYAPGKWTIKDILVHLIDDERIYAYRALRFARGDQTDLPGFDQDAYAPLAGADERQLASIFEEYLAVRAGTIALYNSFDDEALLRRGVADGHPMSVRAIIYHIAGHELHHIKVIRERYLGHLD